MFNLKQVFRVVVATLAAGFSLVSQAVTMSQTPLLTQSGSITPNLMLIFDDSGSMSSQYLYQYGGTANAFGYPGPGVKGQSATCPSPMTIDVTCTYNSPSTTLNSTTPYYELSPDVNRMSYDPRVLYKVRLTSVSGVTTTKATASTADFLVFLYKNALGSPAVWGGTAAEPDPTLQASYFSPYTPNATLLAAGSPVRSYPVCIGTSAACTALGGAGPFPKFINRTDCNGGLAGGSCSLAEEQQNYANWVKFHSNRLDLAKTGLGYAFQYMDGTLRLGWSVISELGSSGGGDHGGGTPATTLGATGEGVSLLDQARKNALYTWLYSRDASSMTPLRESLIAVGKYFSRADNLGPWADTPDPTSKGLATLSTTSTDTLAKRLAHASCRRSFALLTTDGYYNDDDPATGDTDYTAITTITGSTPSGTTLTFNYNGRTKPYAKQSPASTSYAQTTMADVAMKYWITDLRPDLINNVAKTSNNDSFWQNMGFYAVGLGVFGTLPQTAATLDAITLGTTAWPDPLAKGNNAITIDDMWHATVNARGRMLSAQNADALSDGVEGMLSDINKVESSQSGVAASTLSLTTTTRKYTPNYTTGSWIGNVLASNLEPKSGAELCTQWRVSGSWLADPLDATKTHWYVGGKWDGTPDLPPCTGTPSSYSGITYTGRVIYAWNGSAMGTFDSSNSYVTSATTGVASAGGLTANANLINYLRGDQSNEDIVDAKGMIVTSKSYRARPFLLGDIVNSTPTFIKGALNMSYDKLPAGTYGQASYNAFIAAKAARAEGVLFAGGNDGMLHGFRDGLTASDGLGGKEVFAFVPRAVMPKMSQLAGRSYNHQYYVDGPTVEADACLTGGSSCTVWSNLLLGTAGAGAKTVFALDVTNPTSMTAASVKWEITTTSPATAGIGDYANLGNIVTDVQTGLTVGGQWVAVFGNGYTGADGKAHLYVANLDTGARIADIPAGLASNNGLGGVRLLRDANQRIIAAYAGDLNGSLWKFDLSNANPASWGVGVGGAPLYKTLTTPVKPITATPTVVAHPLNGYVVAFGTGKLFESTDVPNTDRQSLYGVWDSVTPPAATVVDRSSLVLQTISAAISGSTIITNMNLSTTTVALNYYSVSRNPINWTTASTTPRGWYIDLPNSGQRVIYPLETLLGKYAAVDTVSPSNVVTNPCLASGSGKAWNYVIDMVTGGGPNEAIFDTNGDSLINTSDLLVSGYENAADGRTRYIKNEALSNSTATAFTPLSTQQLPTFQLSCKLLGNCKTAGASVVKRTWRQLFLR